MFYETEEKVVLVVACLIGFLIGTAFGFSLPHPSIKVVTATPLCDDVIKQGLEQNACSYDARDNQNKVCSRDMLNDCLAQYRLTRAFGDCVNNAQYCKEIK